MAAQQEGSVVMVDPVEYPVDNEHYQRNHGDFLHQRIFHLFGPPPGNGSLSDLKRYIQDMFFMYQQSPNASQPVEYELFLEILMDFIKEREDDNAMGGRKKQRRSVRRSVIKKRKSMSKKRKNGRKSNKKQRRR
jgi:hypothetical protein